MNTAILDSRTAATWRDIRVTDRKSLRRRVMMKHGSITNAAISLRQNYQYLSDIINGRVSSRNVVAAIQNDLDLTDEQVLQLWPQLREWPRDYLPPVA